MKFKFYLLKDKNIIGTNNIYEWGKMFEDFKSRIIAQDNFREILISTVFLGINHGFDEEKPLLFETMIFGGKNDGYTDRYNTYSEAEEGHKKAVELVRNELYKD